MAKQESVGFMEFTKKYDTEENCSEHLFEIRWPNGFICPMCCNSSYYHLTTRDLFECTSCKYQASVTAGAIMERTHLKLQTWFWAIYLIGRDKRGYQK